MSSKCDAVLADGFTARTCHDFRAIRELIACRAWRRVREGASWHNAVKEGWEIAKQSCPGGDTPELRAGNARPEIYREGLIEDAQGNTIGRVAQWTDGHVYVCEADSCSEVHTRDDIMDAIASELGKQGLKLKELAARA